jgi:hypothetical protein
MFYSDTFPKSVQSLWLSKEKMLSDFAIGLPGQCRVPLLFKHINEYFKLLHIFGLSSKTWFCFSNISVLLFKAYTESVLETIK